MELLSTDQIPMGPFASIYQTLQAFFLEKNCMRVQYSYYAAPWLLENNLHLDVSVPSAFHFKVFASMTHQTIPVYSIQFFMPSVYRCFQIRDTGERVFLNYLTSVLPPRAISVQRAPPSSLGTSYSSLLTNTSSSLQLLQWLQDLAKKFKVQDHTLTVPCHGVANVFKLADGDGSTVKLVYSIPRQRNSITLFFNDLSVCRDFLRHFERGTISLV